MSYMDPILLGIRSSNMDFIVGLLANDIKAFFIRMSGFPRFMVAGNVRLNRHFRRTYITKLRAYRKLHIEDYNANEKEEKVGDCYYFCVPR